MGTISTENLSNVLTNAKTYGIITHKRPDGDAISSSLAMFWYLVSTGKSENDIDVIIPEFLDDFSFIPGTQYIKKAPTKDKYDIVIVVDCACMHLLEGIDILNRANQVVCFDHHEETTINFDFAIIDSYAPSCTCIIYETFNCINQLFLVCIAVGLISDTNNLTLNSSNRAKTIYNNLKDAGVNTKEIVIRLTSSSNRTLGLAKLAKERGYFSENIFCTYLLQNDLLDSEKSLNTLNHKAIIAELQNSVQYTFLILAIENDQEELKGSMRSADPNIDLNQICSKLIDKGIFIKGGGHSYSAGFTAIGDLDNIFNAIISEIQN